MEYVENQAHSEWDFNLHIGGQIFPVEVTRSTSEHRQRMYARILGRDGESQFIERRLAKNDWWVFPSHIADIRRDCSPQRSSAKKCDRGEMKCW